MKLNEENVNFIHTTKIEEKFFSSQNFALAIIPASNNSQTNDRNVVKICFQAICEVNFKISLKNLGFILKKLKLSSDPPCRRTPKKNFNTSYRTKMKLEPFIVDYCQIQFDT